MNFLHPEFLWLAPLVGLPVLIHLLNRVRYRRVRWAAIHFLLTSERRAVRRARLQQLLLMALRTLLLAFALLVLLQPILRGNLAGLLGGSTQVAVVIDASASMSAAVASGNAIGNARDLAADAVASLPANARATAGAFAARYVSPFREPLLDRSALAGVIRATELTGGAGDVPAAIRGAAQSLERAGGGGTLWLLTDLQAANWRATDAGAWQRTLAALESAGRPRLIVSDLAPTISANFSIIAVRTTPAVLVENTAPKLTATIKLRGKDATSANVSLFLDGRRIDSRTVTFDDPGQAEAAFHLPQLSPGDHAGYLELDADAMPGDDRFYFVLRTGNRIPVLVIEGSGSSAGFAAPGDFLELAAQPPEDAGAVSPLTVKRIPLADLPGTTLKGWTAVFLADVPALDPPALERLREYVEAGGLLMVFPGKHTNIAAWNDAGFPGVPIKAIAEAEDGKPIKVSWASPNTPVTASLPAEGLDQIAVKRLMRYDAADGAQVLATTDSGDPFLIRRQIGRGKAYLFAVSSQVDFSNLPLTPVLLLTVHRAVLAHRMQAGAPLCQDAFTEVRLALPPGKHQVLTPGGKLLPVFPAEDTPGAATFSQTEQPGVYRLIEGDAAPDDIKTAPVVAAVNVPERESALERIDLDAIRSLLPGYPVRVIRANGSLHDVSDGTEPQRAATTFPLALLAMLCLVGEVLLAWNIDRPGARQ